MSVTFVLLTVSLPPPTQGTPTVFLPWTTSAAPWRWAVSWTEKTHSTQRDSLSLSRWAFGKMTAFSTGSSRGGYQINDVSSSIIASSYIVTLNAPCIIQTQTAVIRWYFKLTPHLKGCSVSTRLQMFRQYVSVQMWQMQVSLVSVSVKASFCHNNHLSMSQTGLDWVRNNGTRFAVESLLLRDFFCLPSSPDQCHLSFIKLGLLPPHLSKKDK